MEMDSEAVAFWLTMCVCIGLITGLIFSGVVNDNNILLSQEVADDICRQLSGNETSLAEDTRDKKLVCRLPSFDATQNIIFKLNSE